MIAMVTLSRPTKAKKCSDLRIYFVLGEFLRRERRLVFKFVNQELTTRSVESNIPSGYNKQSIK